ncbi:hypothetical protein AVEN_165132-1 [Araneus ventricosus]|uniref:RNase H type-1 domain-containing protein n=1 Tax=Araneus ventricosus TaxID=182803 RepID=A0A4Y2B665_ARAVE|nr:hypothetical protein AVEN_165132-1 [Araneus ventricosus]
MANICCTTTEAHTSPRWVDFCCSLSVSALRKWKGTPINTLTNSVRAELHLFNILHGRIKFYLPPYGKVRDENAKRIYRATILSKLDYGSAIYGSARNSVLKKLDTIHHSALRLCSGAFRTSPTSSLYVDCYEPPLEIRRQMLSLHYYLRISSNTRHPCHGFQLRPFLHRLQQARPSSVPTFFTRMHNLMKYFNLHEVPISLQPSFLPPWKDSEFKYLNPFGSFDKSNTSDTIFQQLFADHRLRFHDFVPIYTDGSKLSSRVSFAVVFPKSVSAFTLLPFCSIFTAEITAVFHALKQILKCPIGKYAIYTDSLSVLQVLNSLHCKSHPLVFSVLDLYEKLISQGFSLVFCWVPSHVGIAGNEQADSNARSATHFSHEPVPVCDLKKHIKSCLQMKWQIHWDQELNNKLRSIKPIIENWSEDVNRKRSTILTRLRIGHTRFTHRHLLLGEPAPTCPHCSCTMSVKHILIECKHFKIHRLRFFNTSSPTLTTMIGRHPHIYLFEFLKITGFYPHI